MSEQLQWLTFAPPPTAGFSGHDAGRSTFVLHAIRAKPHETFAAVRFRRTLCDRLPAHGYDLDMFVERRRKRCAKLAET